jgi:hypothetical protein
MATFKKLRNGEWGIQGSDLKTGNRIRVTKKNGSGVWLTVGAIVFSGQDGYTVAEIARDDASDKDRDNAAPAIPDLVVRDPEGKEVDRIKGKPVTSWTINPSPPRLVTSPSPAPIPPSGPVSAARGSAPLHVHPTTTARAVADTRRAPSTPRRPSTAGEILARFNVATMAPPNVADRMAARAAALLARVEQREGAAKRGAV